MQKGCVSEDAYGKIFVEKMKEVLGFKAKGREVMEGGVRYHLREEATLYGPFRGRKRQYRP